MKHDRRGLTSSTAAGGVMGKCAGNSQRLQLQGKSRRPRRGGKVLGVAIMSGVIFQACALPDSLSPVGRRGGISKILTSLNSTVDLPACGIARDEGSGVTKSVAIGWSQLQQLFPRLPAPSTKKAAYQTIRFAALPTSGGSQPVTFTCAIPYDRAFRTALEKLVARRQLIGSWESLNAVISAAGSTISTAKDASKSELFRSLSTQSASFARGALSHQSALSPIQQSSQRLQGLLPQSASLSVFGQFTNTLENPQTLPGVTITASGGHWIFDAINLHEMTYLAWRMTSNPWYQIVNPYEFCDEANEFYFAALAERDEAQADADALDAMATLNETLNCQPVADTSKTMCLDFFIQDRWVLGIGGGDDRDFNSEAPWRASRVQMYVNPTTLAWEVKYSPTRIYIGGPYGDPEATWYKADSGKLWRPNEDVAVEHRGDTLYVRVKFFNSFCTSRLSCPAIDGQFWLVPDATKSSGWDMYWIRDPYPAVGAYKRNSNTSGTLYDTIKEDPQRLRGKWYAMLQLTGFWGQSVRLPQYCNVQ